MPNLCVLEHEGKKGHGVITFSIVGTQASCSGQKSAEQQTIPNPLENWKT
jgi:hypothetical protein